MLASMGNFFKTDLGSMLPKMGMTSELYDEIINKCVSACSCARERGTRG